MKLIDPPIVLIAYQEGEKICITPSDNWALTKNMVMSLPIVNNRWGGWIHTIYVLIKERKRHLMLARYDAYNDGEQDATR
jgi:hypothetical protein